MIPHEIHSRSAERTMRLFEVFAESCEPQTLSDLSRRVGVPISTCHGLVRTLQGLGYLYSLGGSRRLYPTKKLAGLADRIAMRDPIIELFAEALTGLRDASGETVILGTRQADTVVYLDVRQSHAVICYSAQPGDLKPLHSSAIGKLLLGEMPESERRKTLARLTLSRVTDSTLADPETLWNELEDGRRAGCYVTRGENVAEVMALACPVRVTSEVFGVALAGPIQRMERRVDELRSLLLEATAEVNGWPAT